MFWFVSFAQENVAIEAVEYADAEIEEAFDILLDDVDYSSCSFTLEQQALLQEVHTMFSTHAESKIAMRLFDRTDYQDLVRAYSVDFVSKIQATLAECEWNWLPVSTFYSYENFTDWLADFIGTLQMLRQVESQVNENDPVFGAMQTLRDHLFWDILAFNLPERWYLQQTVQMEMIFKMNDEEENVDVAFVMWWDSVTDVETMEMMSEFDVWLNLDIDDGYTDMIVWWNVTMDIRLVDGHLYIKMSDLKIDMWDMNFDSEWERAEFDNVMNMMKLFQGKYIDIPLMPESGMWNDVILSDPMMMFTPEMMFGNIQNQQQMILDMVDQDWMMTYAKAWNTNYIWLNPAACGTMSDMGPWMVSDCLWFWSDMIDETEWKWMMFVAMEWSTASMWITDRFMEDKMPEEIAYFNDKPVITRNDQKIVDIDIPFPEDIWWFKYGNENVSFRAKFPEYSYNYDTWEMEESYVDVLMSGIWKPEEKYVRGTIKWDDVDATVALDIEWGSEDLNVGVSFEMKWDTQKDMPEITFMMTLAQQQEFIDAAIIEAPYEWDVIDMNMLMELWWQNL